MDTDLHRYDGKRKMERKCYVYMLASGHYGTLYIGMTSDLAKRIWEHKEGVADGFTKQHNVKTLVYFEVHENAEAAITRKRQMKEWKRDWKINLIEKINPHWEDLYDGVCI